MSTPKPLFTTGQPIRGKHQHNVTGVIDGITRFYYVVSWDKPNPDARDYGLTETVFSFEVLETFYEAAPTESL